MHIISGINYTDDTEEGVSQLYGHISGENPLPSYNGDLTIENGVIQSEVSIVNARSLAENVKVYNGDELFSGNLTVEEGKPVSTEDSDYIFKGESLVHSAPLTAIAFQKGFFGGWGQYIVSIGLLLFAFSTAISWSYYGDRAMTFLLGSKSVVYYRIVYVGAFFLASFADTTIIWTLSGITIALMTLPNLFGLLYLRKEIKSTISDYWVNFKKEFPDEKTPE